jgi:hypothetical protein
LRAAARVGLAFLAPLAAASAVFFWFGHGLRKTAGARTSALAAPETRRIDASGRTEAESHAIALELEAWSKQKGAAALRVAEDADAVTSEARGDLADLYDEYHPFFLRGDLDGDGRLDFAQAFVETGRGGAWFHVAAFFGRADGGFEPPVWVEHAVSLASGDLSIERTLLIVTPDLGVDEARRWRFDRVTRKFVDADEAVLFRPEIGDEAAPDQAPRVRI